MTKKQDKVTGAGAVVLEESQLDQANGGIIAVKATDTIVQKVADGSVNKIVDGTSNVFKTR